jgi:hydrogenase maturation protease
MTNGKQSEPAATLRCCFIGIGNTLAGDDGAGIVALERLREHFADTADRYNLEFTTLDGDLYAMMEMLSPQRFLIFLDAIAGTQPGDLHRMTDSCTPVTAASHHQLDIATVMQSLQRLNLCNPFPPWEIRGITITPPEWLSTNLSPMVDQAINQLVTLLIGEIENGTLHPQS